MSNAFRYLRTAATLYKWAWPDGWEPVDDAPLLPPDMQLELEVTQLGVVMSELSMTETTEGTIYEFVPY